MKEKQYPLYDDLTGEIITAGERPIEEISEHTLLSGELSPDDLRIHASTLLQQAIISKKAGFERLAENLTRASELTRVPNQELLRLYEALRPRRSTYGELLAIANELDSKYAAKSCADMFRETAEVYLIRSLLRVE